VLASECSFTYLNIQSARLTSFSILQFFRKKLTDFPNPSCVDISQHLIHRLLVDGRINLFSAYNGMSSSLLLYKETCRCLSSFLLDTFPYNRWTIGVRIIKRKHGREESENRSKQKKKLLEDRQ